MNKLKNIPELRFPEFKDDGEWEEKKTTFMTFGMVLTNFY